MKLVIEIDEHEYNKALNGNFNVTAFSEAVRKHSTPLPKGHGRLIDADMLKTHKYHDSNRYENAVAVAYIEWAETIIPADKDCRDCNEWKSCECGKKGHENGTSKGYSIGECMHFIEADKDCTDCILDGTDACTRGAGRAVDAEVCEDFLGEEE